MNPLGVLRARDVMRIDAINQNSDHVDADARVQTVMKTLVSSDADLVVVENGTPIGVIGKNDVLTYLSDPTGNATIS